VKPTLSCLSPSRRHGQVSRPYATSGAAQGTARCLHQLTHGPCAPPYRTLHVRTARRRRSFGVPCGPAASRGTPRGRRLAAWWYRARVARALVGVDCRSATTDDDFAAKDEVALLIQYPTRRLAYHSHYRTPLGTLGGYVPREVWGWGRRWPT
jgi:hypothetical protein